MWMMCWNLSTFDGGFKDHRGLRNDEILYGIGRAVLSNLDNATTSLHYWGSFQIVRLNLRE